MAKNKGGIVSRFFRGVVGENLPVVQKKDVATRSKAGDLARVVVSEDEAVGNPLSSWFEETSVNAKADAVRARADLAEAHLEEARAGARLKNKEVYIQTDKIEADTTLGEVLVNNQRMVYNHDTAVKEKQVRDLEIDIEIAKKKKELDVVQGSGADSDDKIDAMRAQREEKRAYDEAVADEDRKDRDARIDRNWSLREQYMNEAAADIAAIDESEAKMTELLGGDLPEDEKRQYHLERQKVKDRLRIRIKELRSG